jgi:small-conductance mechanosensitive channel
MLREEEVASSQRTGSWWSTLVAIGLLVLLGVTGVILYYIITSSGLLPTDDEQYLRLALILALGLVGITIVGRIIHGVSRRFAGRRHAGLVADVYRIAAYPILAIVALYAVGVNGYALLAGGTFAGLVVGLASQTALANLVAGIVLVLVRPFEPGDRLTLTTSQYSMLMPAYPPKFFSQDLLIPGFTGTVQDIGLMYTALRLDEGTIALFPNSIVIMAAVISHTQSERWVRVKYEVPSTVDPARVLTSLRDAVSLDDWVLGKKSVKVYINQATLASYIVSVDALCAGNLEEPPRSALYVRIMKVVVGLTPSTATPASPGTSVPPPPPSPPVGPPPASPGSNPLTGL